MLAGADFDCDPDFSTLHLDVRQPTHGNAFPGKSQPSSAPTLAHHNGIAAEVREGLTVGERVIVHPPDSVSEDGRVAW